VAGTTGAQGGSVVDFLVRDGTFAVRAITRSKNSDKSKAFAKKYPGVELADAELTDHKSMATALTGAHALFLVTQFWEKLNADDEVKQGTAAIDAAVEAKVSHVVFSTLPSGPLLSGGKIHVPHFDGKWKISQYLAKQAAAHKFNYTYLFVPYYFENLANPWFGPKPDAQGRLVFTYAMEGKGLAVAAVSDVGGVVVPILKEPAKLSGKLIDLVGEVTTIPNLVQTFTRVTGKPAIANDMTPADFEKVAGPAGKDIAEMFALDQLIDRNRKDQAAKGWTDPYTVPLGLKPTDYVDARKLYPDALNFEGWLKKSGWQQPTAAEKK